LLAVHVLDSSSISICSPASLCAKAASRSSRNSTLKQEDVSQDSFQHKAKPQYDVETPNVLESGGGKGRGRGEARGSRGGATSGRGRGTGRGRDTGKGRGTGKGRDKLARNAAESVTDVGVCTLPFINHD